MNHDLIEVIFTKLTLVYGRDFLGRWEGLDLAAVKADWGHELAGLKPESIAFALKHLPSAKPPTVFEFREIARKSPLPTFKALPTPQQSPESQARVRAMLESLRKRVIRTTEVA